MSLIDDLKDIGQYLPGSHSVEVGKIQGTLSALIHYLEDPQGLLQALEHEEGAAAGVLAHITAKANEINNKAQKDLAEASGLTNLPTYEEFVHIFKDAIESDTLPAASPVQPPASGAGSQPTAPGAPVVSGVPVDVPAVTPAYTEQPTYEQLLAQVNSLPSDRAEAEAAVTASTAALGQAQASTGGSVAD